MNNETETGSTVHLMDEGMDTGAIVLQRRVALSRFDTVRSCQSKTYAIEPRLVLDALMLLEDPGFRPTPQEESHSTVFGKRRKPEDSQIDPNKSLMQLYDFIRSCDPNAYPAFFFLEGQKVCIRLWRPERHPEESDETL
jgi:methionyl-tRNA formyltransferase